MGLYKYACLGCNSYEFMYTCANRFPIKTLCDFEIRDIGSGRRHTVECVLPLNLFNEKIYLAIWFWYVFVFAVTLFGLCRWVFRLAPPIQHISVVRRHLRSAGCDTRSGKILLKRFVFEYLKRDGLLVTHVIADNSNQLMATEFLRVVWEQYKTERLSRLQNGLSDV